VNKNVAKLSQKILCLFLGAVMVFGTMINVAYGMGEDISPMQKLILEAVELDDSARGDFVDVLEEVTPANYEEYVDDVSDIIALTDEDITAALGSFVNYNNTYKNKLLLMMDSFNLGDIEAKDYTMFSFRRIQKMINFEVTGDYYDDRGMRMFISIFKNLKTLTGEDAFFDADDNCYKLDIKVGGSALEGEIDKLIDSMQSLKNRGITTFDGFVNYVEDVINSHANIEIYNFKRFLKSEGLGYSGELKKPDDEGTSATPIQKLYLELISLSKAERNEFLVDVLADLNENNLAGAREKAQKILGSMPSKDLNAALAAFASYSDDNKATMKLAIKLFGLTVEDEGYDTSEFRDICERINFAFTGDYDDDKGFMLFVKFFATIRALSSDDFIYDAEDDQYKIDVKISRLRVYSVLKSKLDTMIGAMDTLNARGINSFDEYVTELVATVNAHPNEQIYNFKKFLGEERLGYDGELPDPTEIAPTPTEEPVVTPTPTKDKDSGGNGGSSNKGGSSSSGSKSTPTTTTEPTSTPAPMFNPFTDLKPNHWAFDSVLVLVANEIIAGYPDKTVRPELEITRAEMAVIVAKAVGLEPIENPELGFEDSSDIGGWAAGYVQAAVSKEIIVGYDDNTFRPSSRLTREEMVVMVMKAYMYEAVENVELDFTDLSDIGSWSMGYVAKSVEMEFVEGYPDQSFKPKKDVTRAEASAVIAKCMKAVVEEADEE